MKEKNDFLKVNGYEFDRESDNFVNRNMKNVFTLDFLYDNTINNIRDTHEHSDSTHFQFFTVGAPNEQIAEEMVRKYGL